MGNLLQQVFLDNTVAVYLEIALSILIAFLVKKFISKYLANLLYRSIDNKQKQFRKANFLTLIIVPLETFLFILIILIALDKLNFPTVLDFSVYRVTTKSILSAIASMALIISFIRLCMRFVQFAAVILEEKADATHDPADNQLIIFFKDFFRVLLFIAGVLLVLRFALGYDVSKLITGLSLVGAAIALATKESLENLIASFIIFFDKPFSVGDVVKVQSFMGTVEKIGLRSTRIRTDHKTFITVPNKQMVDSILDNISLRTQRRADIALDISLGVKVEDIRKLMPELKKIFDREHVESAEVFFSNTGKHAHTITIEYFTDMEQTASEFNDLREAINFDIAALLEANAIDLSGARQEIKLSRVAAEPGIESVDGKHAAN